MVSHNPPTLSSHRYCGGEDVMFLVGHVISQNHVIKAPYDAKAPCHPAKFVGHRHSGKGETFLLSHMTLQGHMIKGSRDFMSGSSSV